MYYFLLRNSLSYLFFLFDEKNDYQRISLRCAFFPYMGYGYTTYVLSDFYQPGNDFVRGFSCKNLSFFYLFLPLIYRWFLYMFFRIESFRWLISFFKRDKNNFNRSLRFVEYEKIKFPNTYRYYECYLEFLEKKMKEAKLFYSYVLR